MPGPEECFESKQALNARFRESNRNISPIEKDYHTNLKECKNDILFIAYGLNLLCNENGPFDTRILGRILYSGRIFPGGFRFSDTYHRREKRDIICTNIQEA